MIPLQNKYKCKQAYNDVQMPLYYIFVFQLLTFIGSTFCPASVKNCHVMGSLPYYIVSLDGTWYEAVDFCDRYNDVLASIPLSEYNSTVQTISTVVTNLHIGFSDVWLGLRKQEFQYNTCEIYIFMYQYSILILKFFYLSQVTGILRCKIRLQNLLTALQ